MAFATDTFAGTSGSAVNGRTASGGGTWAADAAGDSSAVISNANRFRSISDNSSYYIHSATPPSADYPVAFDIQCFSNAGNPPFMTVGAIARWTSSTSFYRVAWVGFSHVFQIQNLVTNTTVCSISFPSDLTIGHTYHVIATFTGALCALSVQDTTAGTAAQTTSATDGSPISGAGSVGVFSFGTMTNTAGIHLSNYVAGTPPATPTFTASPTAIHNNTTGNVITLVGTSTAWTGGTTFSVSGVSGTSITSQTVTDSTHASITLTAGATAGTLTISDNTDSATATIAVQNFIAITDSDWYFSPYNWYKNGSTYAQTNNNAAYCKFVFSGTAATLNLDMSPLTSGNVVVRVSVDAGAYTDTTLTNANSTLTVATGLASGNHYALVIINHLPNTTPDRWGVTATLGAVIRFTGLVLDNGAALQSNAAYVSSSTVLCYGDSITENQASGVDTYSWHLGQGLGFELGNVGFGAQGWTTVIGGGSLTNGNGNIPAFYSNPGGVYSSVNSSWDKLDGTGHTRSFSTQPTYIVVNEGTNDANAGASDAAVTASVSAFLTAMRAACPTSKIFVVIPFGQFKATAISTGFSNYQTATPDANCFKIDCGTRIADGLQNSAAGIYSDDGLHPNNWRAGDFGAVVARRIQAALTTTGGVRRGIFGNING